MCKEVTAQPPFTWWWYHTAQYCKIARIINLPIFGAYDQYGSLILCTTVQCDRIQATYLLRFILIDWIRVFVFVANKRPNFYRAGCCNSKDYIVLALWWPQNLQKLITNSQNAVILLTANVFFYWFTYMQCWYPIRFHFRTKREDNFQAERIHNKDLCVITVTE